MGLLSDGGTVSPCLERADLGSSTWAQESTSLLFRFRTSAEVRGKPGRPTLNPARGDEMNPDLESNPADLIYKRIASLIWEQKTFKLGDEPQCPSIAAMIAEGLNAREKGEDITPEEVNENLEYAVVFLRAQGIPVFENWAGKNHLGKLVLLSVDPQHREEWVWQLCVQAFTTNKSRGRQMALTQPDQVKGVRRYLATPSNPNMLEGSEFEIYMKAELSGFDAGVKEGKIIRAGKPTLN